MRKSKYSELRSDAAKLKQSGMTYGSVALRLGVPVGVVTYLLKSKRPRDRFGGKCEDCGKFSNKIHRHHLNYETDTVRLLCPMCHVHAHNPRARIARMWFLGLIDDATCRLELQQAGKALPRKITHADRGWFLEGVK